MSTLEERRCMARDWQVYNQVLHSNSFQRLVTWGEQEKTLMGYNLTLAGSEGGWVLAAITMDPESASEPMFYVTLRSLEETGTMTLYEIAECNMRIALSTLLLDFKKFGVEK